MYTNAATDNKFTGQVSGGEYIYPSAPENAVITFSGFYLSASDNDFAESGLNLHYMACDSEDITVGNAPSAVLNVAMLNPYGLMESLTWGNGTAYIGVSTQSGNHTSLTSGTLIYCNYSGTIIRATATQFSVKIGGNTYTTSISGNVPLGIVVDDAYNIAYLYTDNNVVACNLSTHAFTTTTPADSFMVRKYRNLGGNTAVIVTSNGCPTGITVTDADALSATYNDYTYIPMGVFDFSNVEASGISFGVEAYDLMTLFDADATDWVNNLDFTSPKTLSTIISELMTEMGMSYTVDASAVNTSVSWSMNPITSYSVTYRQVLKWLAEAIGCNVRMTRAGDVEFVAYHSTPVGNAVTCDTIVGNSRTRGKSTIPQITKVVCYNTVGAGYEDGADGSNYYVVANPFIDPSGGIAPVSALLGLLDDIPAYYSTALGVMYSDPRIDAGDFITVYDTDNDPLNAYVIPVMSQTIMWNGICRTEYIASGNQVRQIPDSMEGTGLSEVVSSNPSAIVNMIMAKGITVYDSSNNVLFSAIGDDHLVVIAGFDVTNTAMVKEVESPTDVFRRVYVGIDEIRTGEVDLTQGFAISKTATMNKGEVSVYENYPEPGNQHVYYTSIDPEETYYHQYEESTGYTKQATITAEEIVFGYTGDSNETTVSRTGITLTDGVDTSVLTAGIGKRVHSNSNTSLSSGTTLQELDNFTLTKGLWMTTITVRFASNATGRRSATLSNTSGGSAYNVRWGATNAAVSGAYTYLHMASTLEVTAASATFYINAYQNSGSSLSVDAAWDAVRIY